jgi:hypothetical protein
LICLHVSDGDVLLVYDLTIGAVKDAALTKFALAHGEQQLHLCALGVSVSSGGSVSGGGSAFGMASQIWHWLEDRAAAELVLLEEMEQEEAEYGSGTGVSCVDGDVAGLLDTAVTALRSRSAAGGVAVRGWVQLTILR